MNKQVEQIKAEIERRLSVMPKSAWGTDELKRLLSFIDSLQEESKPKFNVGDIVRLRDIRDGWVAKVKKILEDGYRCNTCFIPFKSQDDWVLVRSSSSEDRLRKASKEYLKVLSETPYNYTPVSNALTIVKELVNYLDNPSKYNPDHIGMTVSDDLKKFAEEWDESLYRSDAVIAGAKWHKQQMIKSAKLSGWVARDENGSLHLFEVEPSRIMHRWWDRDYHRTGLNESDFPDLKWEDEPVYVKLPIIVED